jgi:hypothetical protein
MLARELRADTHCIIPKKKIQIAPSSLDLDPRRSQKTVRLPSVERSGTLLRTQRQWHCKGIYASTRTSQGTEAEPRSQDSRIWRAARPAPHPEAEQSINRARQGSHPRSPDRHSCPHPHPCPRRRPRTKLTSAPVQGSTHPR